MGVYSIHAQSWEKSFADGICFLLLTLEMSADGVSLWWNQDEFSQGRSLQVAQESGALPSSHRGSIGKI